MASLLCSSDAVNDRQTSDIHDIDECWTINSEAALPAKPTTAGRAATK
jgi:hypothetical protein